MKTKKIFSVILISLGCSGLFLACGSDPGETAATVTSGASSSGDGGGPNEFTCVKDILCQDCLFSGCDEKTPCLPEKELKKYFDIRSCLEHPKTQELCPSCLITGIPTDECRMCAATENVLNPHCELDCEECGLYENITTCEICVQNGCEFNTPTGNQCYAGVVGYTDIIGCLQAPDVQTNCVACQGIKAGDPIKTECIGCAKAHVNSSCRLSCASTFVPN